MLTKFFGKKQIQEEIVSPIKGKVVKIEETPDEAFAEKMLGDGVAIWPEEGKVVSPVKGKIIQVFPTKHAIGIEAESGLEILIHVGLDTVKLKGEGFVAHIEPGDRVSPGDLLLSFDLEMIKDQATSIITPVVITNLESTKKVEKIHHTSASLGETTILKVEMK